MTSRVFQADYLQGEQPVRADLRLSGGRLTGRVVRAGVERAVEALVARAADGTLTLTRDGRTLTATVVRSRGRLLVAVEGCGFEVERQEPGAKRHAAAGAEPFAASPMTGLVAQVAVARGQRVAAGATLFVVEAMKMEFSVKAPRAVTVAEVRRAVGQKVTLGEVVVTFEETP